jgi:hypothetical protein
MFGFGAFIQFGLRDTALVDDLSLLFRNVEMRNF